MPHPAPTTPRLLAAVLRDSPEAASLLARWEATQRAALAIAPTCRSIVGVDPLAPGVCLTVIEFDAMSFQVDASTETLSLSTLGALAEGAAMNLERAMRPNARINLRATP